ncbi:MAG: GTPase HflX, partial [Woeseiaceae bacterium]|nr:GTPase HflX [Woeseiaceae bacterium]
IDASDPNRWQRVRQVNSVLKQLDADQVPQIRVYNKIDKLDRQPRITNNRDGEGRAVWLSAITGEGIPMLKDAIARRLRQKTVRRVIHLMPHQGRQRAKLFELGAVSSETVLPEGGWTLDLKMTEKDLRRFLKRENLAEQQLDPLPMSPSASAANE